MKKIIVLLSITAAFLLQACEKKGPGDNYDFSNSLPPYVEISDKAQLKVVEGTNAVVQVRLKTAVQEPVTVNYNVTGTFSTSGTVTIPRDALTANVTIAVPANSSGNATFKITEATKGSTKLTIGAKGVNSNEVRSLLITKNLISFTNATLAINETVSEQIIKVPITIASPLKAQTTLSYTVTPKAGNAANSLTVLSANPLIIAAGEKTAFIEIKVNDNSTVNVDNIYEVKLTGASAPAGSEASIDADKATYTITVSDDLKKVDFVNTTAVDVTVAENKNFEVKLSGRSATTVTVPFTISGGNVGTDYILRTAGTLTFSPGSTSTNINLDIPVGYGINKTLKITLGAVSGNAETSLGTANELLINLK
ncbi:Calx-beta domain-containing protein [Pedobacter sp. ASV1-7]|uniref:Calx-beta domain-containing protein n=1 Tax=Pedobacter sp. ASV1-7 TaxID=3145237 RepID=UPI0032E9217D